MLMISALALLFSAQANADNPPKVTSPPAAFFEKVAARDRDPAKSFYKKYIDVKGLPVVASREVADQALQRTFWIVTHLLSGRPDVLVQMAKSGMYLIVIGKDQVYTDMPEYRNSPNPEYMNERVRGTGGRPTSFGEENLLSLPIDRYDDESIGVHEFCHTIDSAMAQVDSTWSQRRSATFRAALAKGLWKNTYAGSNPGEYWAEICQSYFDCNRVNNWNHGPIGTREQLRAYDPEGYELVRKAFNLSPQQDWRYTWLRKLPGVYGPPARFKIDPYYTKFTWAREFPVVGRGARDESLLAANDTIRKMFAYRHDILKALINGGVKLVVLGEKESVDSLPEFRGRQGVDSLSRIQDYAADSKTLVVPEDGSGLSVAASKASGAPMLPAVATTPYPLDPALRAHVIRVMARALYRVCAARPVDPNWNSRGRDVQQYELRVKRLDVQFDERLKALFDTAIGKGKWKGTTAAHSREDYFVSGVLAYFDAPTVDAAPNDAEHPINSRELLKSYDPELFALVNETMAYEGKVDWRVPKAIL